MIEEKQAIITYQGAQINLFSDNRADYVNLTDLAKAYKTRKSILSWIRNTQTIEFLNVWEKKYNINYNGAQMSTVLKLIKDRNLSIKQWVELTNANGILTRSGEYAGTYAHKDIAIRFAGWLNPEFELYLVEEIQKLKHLEEKVNSLELLNEEQILALIRLKEVFKYVSHQIAVEDAHKDLYAARSGGKNPFLEFNGWRNKILDIEKAVINERIKQYCIENKIPMHTANKLMKQPKREQILKMDSYESVKIAVWDFLTISGEVNALHLANLVEKMVKIEKAEIIRENKTDLLHIEQDLGEFNNFLQQLDQMPQIKTARQVLEYRKGNRELKQNLSPFNENLKKALNYNPKDKEVE